MKSNILLSILQELNIPHTKGFVINSYETNPYKFTFFGLKTLCESFGIKVNGLKLEEKNELKKLSTPFVADYSNDHVLVKEISDAQIKIEKYGVESLISYNDFITRWGGHVLLFYPNENSREPNYKTHKINYILSYLEWKTLAICLIMLCTLIISLRSVPDIWKMASIIFSACGIILSTMLLLQQLKVHNSFVESVCNAFKQGSCHNILETKAAKFLGRYSWAEIGFCYFTSNLLIQLVSDKYDVLLAYIGILALPYCIWSIGYQKHINQWCPLCLMVQGVIILQFLLYLFAGYYVIPFEIAPLYAVSLIAFYAVIGLSLHKFLPLLSMTDELQQIKWKYNHLKMNVQVFQSLLATEKKYPISGSSIIFGEYKSTMRVTIFSNPYCSPCAEMHKRLQELLKSGVCQIEYVFTSFSPELNNINKYLIAAYQQLGPQKTWEFYSEWYDKGKIEREKFFNTLGLDIGTDSVRKEFEQHEEWRKQTDLSATPTILVNYHKIPYGYAVEDLQYVL